MEMSEYKPLAVGVDNFSIIMSSKSYYVDKTYFAGKVLDNVTPGGAILFTRPRRFGKSLALSMLRRFFDCNAKEENRPLFEGLAVAQSERHMAEQGKYPVIFLNLKDVKKDNQEKLENLLYSVLYKALMPYDYLKYSNKLSDAEKNYLNRLLSHEVGLDELSISFNFVCSILYKHHGQPVVVLIDEYDAPLQTAYLHGFYQPVCDIMRNMLSSALKSNDYLRLGVITGVTRIAKDSLFSGLNNLEVDTILSKTYADCFGFTPAEVVQMARDYGVPEKEKELQEWYDGYRFGDLDIYNPWSVIKYFKAGCEPQAYWLDTSSNDLTIEALHRLTETQLSEVRGLCEGGYVEASVDTSVSFPQLQSQDVNILFSLMAVSGYLKPIERLVDGLYRLVIPNREIRTIYHDEILSYAQTRLQFHKLRNLHSAIVRGEDARIAELLNEYMVASLSYFDTVEKFYHAWMMGLLFALDDEYVCQSEREAGEGRADLMLQPRPGCAVPGLVFEFKRSQTVKQLPEKADEALQQIEEKRYIQGFLPEVREVLGYGIAFCRKRCAIRQKRWWR